MSLCSDLGTKYYYIPYAFSKPFFGSYGDKRRVMREEGLYEAGDPVGGSRDETIRNTAKKARKEQKKRHRSEAKKKLHEAVDKAMKDMAHK